MADGAVLTDDMETELLSCSVPPSSPRKRIAFKPERHKISTGRVGEKREKEKLQAQGTELERPHLACDAISATH